MLNSSSKEQEQNHLIEKGFIRSFCFKMLIRSDVSKVRAPHVKTDLVETHQDPSTPPGHSNCSGQWGVLSDPPL